jgi:Histones H3 and H4
MTDIPLAPVGRIVKKSGAERVSSDANEELAKLMEQYASRIDERGDQAGGHAGRKRSRQLMSGWQPRP